MWNIYSFERGSISYDAIIFTTSANDILRYETGTSVIVKGFGSLINDEYYFKSWNTEIDVSGLPYRNIMGNVTDVTLHIKTDASGYYIAPWTDTTIFSSIVENIQ